jgi:hypothetical protein
MVIADDDVSGVSRANSVRVCLYDRSTALNYIDKQHHKCQHQQYVNEPTNRVAADDAKQPQDQ